MLVAVDPGGLPRCALERCAGRGLNLKSILVVGAGELGERVVETIEHHRELGFRVTGVLTRNLAEGPDTTVRGAPVIGTTDDRGEGPPGAAGGSGHHRPAVGGQPLMKSLMERLALHTVDVKVVPDLFQYMTLCGGLEEFGGLPIISLQGGPLEGWNLVAKRAFDVLFSLARAARPLAADADRRRWR